MPKGNPDKKELAKAGFDVGAEREKAEAPMHKLEGGSPLPEKPTGAKATLQRLAMPVERQPKWSTAIVATVTLAVGVVTVVAVTAIIWQLKRGEIHAQSQEAAIRKEQAVALRSSATAACRDHRWGECRKGLDDARELDPPGEGTPDVKALRKAIDEATAPPK